MGIFQRKQHTDEAATSQPEGDGPVTLEDRTEPGGEGSPDTNQGKTEPIPPTPDHPEPLGAKDLAAMSPAAGDPQLPEHPAAARTSPPGAFAGGDAGTAPTALGGPGAEPDETRPGIDPATSTGRAHGPLKPVQATSGEAHRVGGLNGETPAGESIESDIEAGATRMGAAPLDAVASASSGHGDTGPAPATGDGPMPGTSETQPKVEGVRLPEA